MNVYKQLLNLLLRIVSFIGRAVTDHIWCVVCILRFLWQCVTRYRSVCWLFCGLI